MFVFPDRQRGRIPNLLSQLTTQIKALNAIYLATTFLKWSDTADEL